MFPLRDNVPTRTFPFVNTAIIVANIAVFFQEIRLAHFGALESFLFDHGLIPAHFVSDPLSAAPTILSAMFLHGSWGHVLGNMWYLYIFGDNVEDNLGHLRYLLYYVLMGVGAASCQIAASPASRLPMIGASGAIAGILGSYFVLYPKARVLSLFIIVIIVRVIEIPAFFFLGFWFLMQAFSGVGQLAAQSTRGEMGGIAWWAHAGGFLTGFLCIPFMRKRGRRR